MISRLLPALLLALVLPLSACLAQDASVPAEGVRWTPFDEAFSTENAEGKKVLVDIYAPWCGYCRKLQREVYTDARVRDYVNEHFVMTRVNGDDAEDRLSFKDYELTGQELAFGLGAEGFPTTIFLNAEAEYITRLPGFVEADEFLRVLQFISTDAFLSQSYADFVEGLK